MYTCAAIAAEIVRTKGVRELYKGLLPQLGPTTHPLTFSLRIPVPY